MRAYVDRVGSLYAVKLGCENGFTVKTYSSMENASAHRDEINMAIDNPRNLNQHPRNKR